MRSALRVIVLSGLVTFTTRLGGASDAFATASRQHVDLPTQYLPVYGGAGGSSFNHSCGAGYVMTGIRYRAGLVIDAIGLLCRPVNSGGGLGAETTVGTISGGGGGSTAIASCPLGSVVAGAGIFYGTYVDGLTLHCRAWSLSSRSWSDPVPAARAGSNGFGKTLGSEDCEAGYQPARGIRGRSGSFVDALGIICDEP